MYLINNLFQILPTVKQEVAKRIKREIMMISNTLINYFCIFNEVCK